MANLKSVIKNTVKSVEDKLKILSKIKGERIEVANIKPEDVQNLAILKIELDKASAVQKKISEQYEVARQKVISQLPGNPEDVVDVTINGVRIHKYPRNTMAGKLNESKVLELIKSKRLLNKVAPLKRILDKKMLIAVLAEDKITYEEYLACTTQNIVPVVEIEHKTVLEAISTDEQAV